MSRFQTEHVSMALIGAKALTSTVIFVILVIRERLSEQRRDLSGLSRGGEKHLDQQPERDDTLVVGLKAEVDVPLAQSSLKKLRLPHRLHVGE